MKHIMILFSMLSGYIFISQFTQTGTIQKTQSAFSGCQLLNKIYPPQLIIYERSEKKSNKEDIILLRLLNNSSCDILVPTADLRLTKYPDGSFTTDIQDKAAIEIYYEFEGIKPAKSIIPGAFSLGDEINVSRLPSGRSAIFKISKSRILTQQYIRIPFKFEWEGGPAPSTGLVKHYVYFDVQNIMPKAN